MLFLCVGVTAVVVLYTLYVHKYVPEDCPDRLHVQVIADFMTLCERLAELSEKVAVNRWWPFPGRTFNPANRIYPKADTKLEWKEYAGVKCLLVTPGCVREGKKGVVVFYHGGGWVMGSINSYKDLLVDIAEKTSTIVMSPEYRLAPEHPFPVPFDDCVNSTMEFLSLAHEYNIDLNKIVIMGDSAGGNLAFAATAHLQRMYAGREIEYRPCMQVLVYPYLQMLDFRLPSHVMNARYFVSPTLIQKVWLAYAGLNDRMKLASLIARNKHVDPRDSDIIHARKHLVSASFVDDKYKDEEWASLYSGEQDCGGEVEAVKRNDDDDAIEEEVRARLKKLMFDTRMSPLMMGDGELARMPRTHLLVCRYDPLRDDGLILEHRLRKVGVPTTLQYLANSPHAVMSIGAIARGGFHYKENKKLFEIVKRHLATIEGRR